MSLPAFLAPHKGNASPKEDELSTENMVPTTVNKMPLKQGPVSRSYTNFRSAITAVRAHIRYSLVAAIGIFIGSTATVITSIVVQSTNIRPSAPVYAHVMMLLLIGTAGVSCIGGGLILMNTLLTMVNERSREFSMRLAVGARRRDIRAQILWEAFLLSLIGGVTGIACGLLIGFVLSPSLQISFNVDSIQIALLIGTLVILCVLFALYPAQRAAQLDYGKVLRTN